jgi:hypothetical protein
MISAAPLSSGASQRVQIAKLNQARYACLLIPVVLVYGIAFCVLAYKGMHHALSTSPLAMFYAIGFIVTAPFALAGVYKIAYRVFIINPMIIWIENGNLIYLNGLVFSFPIGMVTTQMEPEGKIRLKTSSGTEKVVQSRWLNKPGKAIVEQIAEAAAGNR